MTKNQPGFEASLQRFEALSQEEAASVLGGESLFYWIAYGVGSALHYVGSHLTPTQSSGQRLMNAAL